MKHLVLAAFLVGAAALSAAGPDLVSSSGLSSATAVVREFVRNDTADAWALGYDWLWTDGVLTHYPFMGTGTATQASMPAFAAGKLYRINVKFSNYLRGSVTLSLANNKFVGYGQDGAYTFRVTVTDPGARLTLTPTADYEGSIASIRVLELGDELVGAAVAKWSPDGTLASAEGHALEVKQLGVLSGHTYQVTFAVSQSTENVPGARVGLGQDERLFSHNGTYSVDVVANQDGRLVFAPQQVDQIYDGTIGQVSVREITSDPTPATPPVSAASDPER